MNFPPELTTIGKKVEYLSRTLLPARRFEEYIQGMDQILGDGVHYIDPVHEFRGKADVLKMLAKYVPRAANDKFQFRLLVDEADQVVWRWTLCLKIRFTWFEMTIHGLVHAEIDQGKITYQREYYDPMESIGVIPLFGRLYKLILRMG